MVHIHPVLSLAVLALGAACQSAENSHAPAAAPTQSQKRLPEGRPLVVGESVRVAPGRYLRPADGSRGGVIQLDGLTGVTLDLRGVELRGSPEDTPLDENAGWGIVLRRCRQVVVRGGRIGGYKACIVALGCSEVVIEDVEFDGWYAQRLRSTTTAESQDDWLYPHENDKDEWVKNHGGAIALTDCEAAVVRRCKGRHGQNGILMTRTSKSEVYDNDFSFMSGWGLAMYRSSKNVVAHNVFDYCVRGYSHDVYWRGQDSAGILMFERCNDNVVAYNSATHGGDGVFVYGGHDLVLGRARERGEKDVGGCDRNVFYANDLSFAVANSLEATFSSHNVAIGNDLSGSHQHGVWGGYSSNMVIADNKIHDTVGGGVTIEHGQKCVVARNELRNNHIGVELYWDEDPHYVGGPFGQQRDTSSSGHWILDNTFENNTQDFVLLKTTGLIVGNNRYSGANRLLDLKGGLTAEGSSRLDTNHVKGWLVGPDGSAPSGRVAQTTLVPWKGRRPAILEEAASFLPADIPGSQVTWASERGLEGGLETIVVGEWGPWDFRSGEPRPSLREPGGLLSKARWDAAWFHWDPAARDPRGDVAAWRALARAPVAKETVGVWTSPWPSEAVKALVGTDHFGLVASTEVTLVEPGRYHLDVVSDDGVRLVVDGKVVHEDWTYHNPRTARVPLELAAGRHELALEYFQIQGGAALSVEISLAR